MADHTHRNHALVPQDERVPSTDLNGFDPGEFEWRPVPRRPRADGWNPETQQRFIQALAEHGTVRAACEQVDMAVGSAYRLRHAPGAESFARAWDAALHGAAARLLDLCFERAIAGVDEPVFDRDGVRIGAKWRFDHRLAMFILRAYMPERFRHAHRDTRAPDEATPPPARPVAEAVAALAPVPPAAPQLTAEPERMAAMIDGARGRAEVEARYPRDERERYAAPPRAADHPAALARRHVRRERVAEREERDGTADWAAHFAEQAEASPSRHLPPAPNAAPTAADAEPQTRRARQRRRGAAKGKRA